MVCGELACSAVQISMHHSDRFMAVETEATARRERRICLQRDRPAAAVGLMGRSRKVQAPLPVLSWTPCGFVEVVLC